MKYFFYLFLCHVSIGYPVCLSQKVICVDPFYCSTDLLAPLYVNKSHVILTADTKKVIS